MTRHRPAAIPPPKGRRVRLTTARSAVTGKVEVVAPAFVLIGGQKVARHRVTGWKFAA